MYKTPQTRGTESREMISIFNKSFSFYTTFFINKRLKLNGALAANQENNQIFPKRM